MVVSLKNIFHSVLFLVLCLFSVAGVYILLQAEFVAAVQVLIYVGAVTVLMIFAIMLTHRIYSREIKQANEQVLNNMKQQAYNNVAAATESTQQYNPKAYDALAYSAPTAKTQQLQTGAITQKKEEEKPFYG